MNTKSDSDDTESEDLSAPAAAAATGGQVDCEGIMHRPDRTATTTTLRSVLPGRAVAALALVASMLMALVGATPATSAPAPSLGDALTRVVVEARADLATVSRAVADQGGRVVEVLTPFPLVVAEVPADTVDALQQDTATGSVTLDTTLHVQSLAGAPAEAAAVAAAGRPARNADAGKGVGVVVVDTGIADHPDLGDRVIARYAPDGNDPDDLHGHGTFMAGLVAGDGEEVDGIAPAANLVSVKVADDEGTTSLSTLLEGLVIADMARDELDAPVVLLAMSGEKRDVPDPVMVVLEMLWARGSTVVVASGNEGALSSPGWDPFVITAGALDTGAHPGRGDDSVPDWSGRGVVDGFGDGWAKPDVVAPGVSVVSLQVDGSTIDEEYPDGEVGDDYFRGTGTSMAAATTAGAAAAILAVNPDLTPDQVKGVLRDTARSVPHADDIADGHGAIDLTRALAAARRGHTYDGNPHVGPLPTPAPDGTPLPDDEFDPDGWSWDGWSWDGWSWDGWSWDGWSWDGSQWTGWSWDGWSWDGWSWDGWSWDGWSWDGWSRLGRLVVERRHLGRRTGMMHVREHRPGGVPRDRSR